MGIQTIPFLKKTISDYGYINARVRAMRAQLLRPSQYLELSSAKNLADIIEILQNTHFAQHFHVLGSAPGLQAIEEVFRRDLCKTTQAILNWVGGRPRELFEILLTLWDMESIKTILRGKSANRSSSEILSSVLPAGRLDEPLLKELAQAADVRSVIEILYTWRFVFGKDLAKVLPQFQESQKTFILEHALENAFFKKADQVMETLNGTELALSKFLNGLRDLFNIRAALRVRDQGLNPAQGLAYFVGKGSHVGKELFLLLIQQETSEAACNLISLHLLIQEKPKDEATLEKVLEHRQFQEGMKAYLGNPLGFDILLGFLTSKIAEIRNMRIITRGKAAQIRAEKIEEELLNVQG